MTVFVVDFQKQKSAPSAKEILRTRHLLNKLIPMYERQLLRKEIR